LQLIFHQLTIFLSRIPKKALESNGFDLKEISQKSSKTAPKKHQTLKLMKLEEPVGGDFGNNVRPAPIPKAGRNHLILYHQD